MKRFKAYKATIVSAFRLATDRDIEMMIMTTRIYIDGNPTVKDMENVVELLENELERRANDKAANPQG